MSTSNLALVDAGSTATTARIHPGTGADGAIAALLECGIDTVFGYPGGAIMPTYDAIARAPGNLQHVLVRHEQGAVHAAEGYARACGRPGVCIATSGPGATNLVTGLRDAQMDSVPLVAITGQVRSDALGSDAFQECDVIGATLSVTKWSYQASRPEDVYPAVREALRIAAEGRPGPVVVDITRDAQSGEVDPDAEPSMALERAARWLPPSGALGPAEVARAAKLINESERPLLMLGHGIELARAEAEAQRLAELSGMPVACTLLGLSAIPVDHPQYVGMLGMHGSYAVNRLTNDADVIVALGMRFDDRVTGRLEDYATGARVIHVDVDPSEIGRHVPVEVGLAGDAREVILALLEHIEPGVHRDWLRCFRTLDEEERRRVIEPETAPRSGAIRMAEVIARLSEATAGEALLVTDVGQHQMIAARYYRFARPASHMTSGGLGTMGFALPAAIGAALAAPQRDVVVVAGDGGFQMSLSELGTVMQSGVPVKMLVLNNGHLGMVRQWQELFFEGRLSGVEIESPDFVAVASGFSIPGRSVHSRADLDEALRELVEASGPYLLEVQVARAENVFPMVPAGASVNEIRLS